MTSYFVPVITLIAILTWVIWMSLGLSGRIPSDWLNVSSGGWVAWSLQFATAVFVVACPCGLALAAPTAIFVGGGIAAKHGILVKGGGEAFEKASKIDCVVFDKTGTLTMGGEPSITDSGIYPNSDDVNEADMATFLAALKAVEENSSHPIAKAIVSFCASKTSEIPGKGMKATYTGFTAESSFELIVGNEALMADFSVHISRTGPTSESTTRRATIAMVGDGINDSPALTTADVGVAIGSGSDVAISSASFVLLNSDLHSVVSLLDLSRVVFRRIKFNFGWAIVYNCIGIPVAAGCLYPIVSHGSHVRLDPVWASLAMALSSISVVTSSLLLRSRVPGVGFRVRRVE
jgi:cation transport ATPase